MKEGRTSETNKTESDIDERVREINRERQRETDRQTDKGTQTNRQRLTERNWMCLERM